MLTALIFAMAAISTAFEYGTDKLARPVILLVVLMMGAGTLYLFMVCRFGETPYKKSLIPWVVLVGLAMRVGMFGSTPMLEDDHYRYLWDGAVLANGFNPYSHAPSQFVPDKTPNPADPLHRLATKSGDVIHRINYPWLRTIYPPVPAAAFALAHMIRPWSLNAWRLVLLGADLATLFLLFMILKRLNLSMTGIMIYWWNPLLVKEIYNSVHMDVLILPIILSTLLLSYGSRPVLASGVLGLAVGTKFWPALLLPAILRPFVSDFKRLVPALLVFGCVSLTMFLPFYLAGLDTSSGFRVYGTSWEMNDSCFMAIAWGVRHVIEIFGLDADHAGFAARAVVFSILIAWTLWIIRVKDTHSAETAQRCLLITAAIYLLSPTQYPWYFLWLLPFLAIVPKMSLLILTPLLSLYYLRYYLSPRGFSGIHDQVVVWVEFGPVWCLLLWEGYRNRGESPVEVVNAKWNRS